MLITRVVSPAPRDEWDQLVLGDRDAVLEQAPIWMDALKTAGGYQDVSRLYRMTDGRSFVLPLVAKSARGRQTGFSSGWGIGGIVGAGLDSDVVSAILADVQQHRVFSTHIRPNPLQHQAWSNAALGSAKPIARRAHAVDLKGGLEETRSRFRRSGRRGIKKAEQAGVTVTVYEAGEGLDQYYHQLYVPSIDRWAGRQNEPVLLARLRARGREPLQRLQDIAASLGTAFRLYMASIDGMPASANIVLMGPHNAHATRGAMDYEIAKESRAGYAADWASIQDACEHGYHWYQMGESGDNRPLSEYKERFGAQAIDYNEYRIERLPLLELDRGARTIVKRVIGFRDT